MISTPLIITTVTILTMPITQTAELIPNVATMREMGELIPKIKMTSPKERMKKRINLHLKMSL